MTDTPDVVNWDDPCERAQRLREAFYALVSGTNAYQITYRGNGIERSVTYSVIDKTLLMSQIREAELECSALMGIPSRSQRYAIKFGARRVYGSED